MRHTSETEIGQVYVPRINYILLIAIIIVVLVFQSSDNLGAAYGIAVSGDMTITTILAFLYMRSQGWSLAAAVPLFAAFATLDLTFLTANMLKFAQGGWFPILVAIIVFSIMGTWWRGRRIMAELRARDALPLEDFVETLNPERPVRVPGTAIFMTRDLAHVPVALLHAMKHYKALHERVIMMQVETIDVPHVRDERRLEIAEIGKGFYTMRVRYGYLDEPNVMRALAQARVQHFRINLMETSFFIGREKLRPQPRRTRFWRWRDRLFILLNNLSLDATEFFRIPPNRVVELGGQIENLIFHATADPARFGTCSECMDRVSSEASNGSRRGWRYQGFRRRRRLAPQRHARRAGRRLWRHRDLAALCRQTIAGRFRRS